MSEWQPIETAPKDGAAAVRPGVAMITNARPAGIAFALNGVLNEWWTFRRI